MKRLLIILATSVIGCGAVVPVDAIDCAHGPSWQCEAQAIAWNQTMGQEDEPPPVQWLDGEACGYTGGERCIPGMQHLGLYLSGPRYIQIAIQPNEHASALTLAHEFLHAHLDRAFGDPDISHLRPEWKTMLPAIGETLSSAGL